MTPQRPRDVLGRPLPHDADPSLIVPGPPERDDLTGAQAWEAAMSYLADGLPFHAHEVFEMRWRIAPAQERDAWRALAQWGAALTHGARGNATGARRLAERAQDTLQRAATVPECIDSAAVITSCERLGAGPMRGGARP